MRQPAGPAPSPDDDPAVRAAYEAEQREMAAKLATIEYPACGEVWEGDKLSACGERVLRTSLARCQSLGAETLGSHPSLLDEYAGDSWIERAGGQHTVARIAERIAKTRREAELVEISAYALGDGTNEIRRVTCVTDDRARLKSVF